MNGAYKDFGKVFCFDDENMFYSGKLFIRINAAKNVKNKLNIRILFIVNLSWIISITFFICII